MFLIKTSFALLKISFKFIKYLFSIKKEKFYIGKLYLEVPEHEYKLVKKLGANWNDKKNAWFIMSYTNSSNFEKWIPKTEDSNANISAENFYLASSTRECYKCRFDTPVYAIILPEGFKAKIDMPKACGGTEVYPQFVKAILSYVSYISDEALKKIEDIIGSGHYKSIYSRTVGFSYFRSICTTCGTAQGDNYTISNSGTPFFPKNVEAYKNIKFYHIYSSIQAYAYLYDEYKDFEKEKTNQIDDDEEYEFDDDDNEEEYRELSI